MPPTFLKCLSGGQGAHSSTNAKNLHFVRRASITAVMQHVHRALSPQYPFAMGARLICENALLLRRDEGINISKADHRESGAETPKLWPRSQDSGPMRKNRALQLRSVPLSGRKPRTLPLKRHYILETARQPCDAAIAPRSPLVRNFLA